MRRVLHPLVATVALVIALAVVPTASARPWPAAKTPTAIGLGGGVATVDAQGTRAAVAAEPFRRGGGSALVAWPALRPKP